MNEAHLEISNTCNWWSGDTPSSSVQVQASTAALSALLCSDGREGSPLKVGRKKHLILDYLINSGLPRQKGESDPPHTIAPPYLEIPKGMLKQQVRVTQF